MKMPCEVHGTITLSVLCPLTGGYCFVVMLDRYGELRGHISHNSRRFLL